jgi:hypothetical protein
MQQTVYQGFDMREQVSDASRNSAAPSRIMHSVEEGLSKVRKACNRHPLRNTNTGPSTARIRECTVRRMSK